MTIDIHPAAEAMRETGGRDCLTEYLRRACKARGLLHYHTHDARHSQKGFPDFVIGLAGGPLIFVELKRQKTRPSEEQAAWLNYLFQEGQRCYLWRPSHWLDGIVDWVLGGDLYRRLWGDPFDAPPDFTGRWVGGVGVPGDKFSLPVVGSSARRARS